MARNSAPIRPSGLTELFKLRAALAAGVALGQKAETLRGYLAGLA